MTTSLIISRTELGLPPLQLQNRSGGYQVHGAVSFSGVQMDRIYPQGVPWVHYERPTHMRRLNGTYRIGVHITAPDQATLLTRTEVLEQAFCEQIEFTIQWTLDGVIRTYRCLVGDMTAVSDHGGINPVWNRQASQPYEFTGPHRGTV